MTSGIGGLLASRRLFRTL
ncbi:hypothetical protein [Edaphobacter aggregans]